MFMEISEKPKAPRPRVVDGPHRFRISGVAPLLSTPADDTMLLVGGSDSEFAATVVEIPVEVIPLDEPK